MAEQALNSRVLKTPHNLLMHLTSLKALDLRRNKLIEELLQEVGKLIQLQFLHLSCCERLRGLLKIICDLYNFQTLNIQLCLSLWKLP